MGTTGAVLAIVSLIPGVPFFPFMLMGAGLGIAAKRSALNLERADLAQKEQAFRPKHLSTLVLWLSSSAKEELNEDGGLLRTIHNLRENIYETTGVIVPEIQTEVDSGLEGFSVQVSLHGMRQDLLDKSNFLAKEDEEKENNHREFFERGFSAYLSAHLVELINDTQTRILLEAHHTIVEDLVNSLIPQHISTTTLTAILRQLVAERVSIREMHLILQALAECKLGSDFKDTHGELWRLGGVACGSVEQSSILKERLEIQELLAAVRIALQRTISQSVVSTANCQVHAWVLAPRLDYLLTQIAITGAPKEADFVEGLAKAARELAGSEFRIILTTKFARLELSRILRSEQLDIPVLAIDELVPEVSLRIKGELSVAAKPTEEESAEVVNGSQKEFYQ